MKKIILIAFICLVSTCSYAQLYHKIKKGNQRRVNRIGTFEMTSQCLDVQRGTQYIVRAFGAGDSETEASYDAKYRVISDILFRGVTKGSGGCSQKPLVFNPNLEDEKGGTLIGELLDNDKETEKIIKDANAEGRVNSKKQSDKIIAFEYQVDISALRSYFTNKGLIKASTE